MPDTIPALVPPYAALAPVYDRAGYSDYAASVIPGCVDYAIAVMNWAGRRVLDLGCGTGVSSWWLAERGYRVGAIDLSPAMIMQAEAHSLPGEEVPFTPPEFAQMDVRQLESPVGQVDLALAIGGVMNALHSLRDVERVLRRVHAALEPGKPLFFDLRTIQGLAGLERTGQDDAFDNGTDLAITVRDRFSFETLTNTRSYTIWQRAGENWQRSDERHVERGYPIQAIVGLLERTGFGGVAVLTPAMEPFDAQGDVYGRAVLAAIRQGD